jgi:hypothetical protein
MTVFIVNMRPYNWQACREKFIFGLRKGATRYQFKKGDLFLIRMTAEGSEYGVKAIWRFNREEPITAETEVPWTDAEYEWLLFFEPVDAEFGGLFNEQFTGTSKYSEKVGLSAGVIIGSCRRLADEQGAKYIQAIIREKSKEIVPEVSKELESLAAALQEKEQRAPKKQVEDRPEDIVGDPINFRGIVYAPLNEAGVILLFSHVMKDLGIFYEASPGGFPDMIGRRRTAKGLQRIRVEFEFRSSNFVRHKHDVDKCDAIVCWEHDWTECPLEVICLKDVVAELT